MATIKEIIDQMVYEVIIVKELNELRAETRKTNDFINVIVFDLSCSVVNKFLGLTNWNDTRNTDNLTVSKSDYTLSQIEAIKEMRLKYKDFRNKVISHTTTTEILASATSKDLERLLSLIRKADVTCCTTGYLKYFLKPMLEAK